MKFDIKDIPNKLSPIFQKIREYSGFMIVLVILGMFGFIIVKIRAYATVQPSQAQIDEKLLELKRTQVDQDSIDKIQELESTNIDVKALFDEARDNPFQE